ncbi:hypothetical protein P8605_24880, partial [Streptomyces sp. T-3]|nr:hypothetical protein [Streptomyces sp. T-3]
AAGPGGRACLYSQRGVARAVAGDRCGAFKDIDLAERWADRADAECGAYPLGALVHQRARIHRAQGDVRRAMSALELSLALRGPGEHLSRALLRIELAELRLTLGEVEGAGELLRLIPSGAAELRSARVATGVAALRRRVLVPLGGGVRYRRVVVAG